MLKSDTMSYTSFTHLGEQIIAEITKMIKDAGITGMAADLPDHWVEGMLSEEEILRFLKNYNNRNA